MEPYLRANTDRGIDNWLALGIIAKRIGSEWVQRVQAALDAVEARQNNEAQSPSVQLLNDVHSVVTANSRPEWPSRELYYAVLRSEGADWSVHNHGRCLSQKQFTQMLGDFGIKPIKRSNANIFYVCDFEDAFARYLTHT